MDKVLYFQHGREPIELFIVAKGSNGTVDLARTVDGPVIISGITLADKPGDGCAIPFSADAPPAKKGKGGKAKTKAEDKAEGESQPAEDQPPTGEAGDLADADETPPPPEE